MALPNSETVPIGNRVIILQPSYLMGMTGIVCGREELPDGQPSDRWLVQVIPDAFIVSLNRSEFRQLENI